MQKVLDAILDIIDAHAEGRITRSESRARLETRLIEALGGQFDSYIRALAQDEIDAVWKDLEKKFPDKFGSEDDDEGTA